VTIHHGDDWLTIHGGDNREVMRTLPAESVQCVVTSPPYWGLRDYGTPGQLGLEPTPEAYVAAMVDVFREVRRVLRPDGTLWLNLGDSYAAARSYQVTDSKHIDVGNTMPAKVPEGLKPKDLVGIPWRVAFALQVDGWYLRSDIIWAKPNPMPESVTDRPTKSHEYLFLLSVSERYHYDADAIREPSIHAGTVVKASNPDTAKNGQKGQFGATALGFTQHDTIVADGRNRRSVWTIATKPYPGAHFATFPEALVEPCILAGCPEGGTVMDPFAGTGTVGLVANRLSRRALLIDLNPDYLAQCLQRNQQMPMGVTA
jgi:DNA modification methylase